MSNQRACKYCGHYLADGKHCTCHESFYMRKNAKLQDEITRLQSEVERLAKFVRAGDRLCYELESWLATEHDKESQRAISIWKRLRQQAAESEQ